MTSPRRTVFRAALIVDAETVCAAPGALLLEGGTVVTAGPPAEIGAAANARVVDRPRAVIMPALVNAHCHLDLTHLGRVPFGGDFVAWIDEVRRGRATADGAIADSVGRGAALCRAGGTAVVGDIAGAGSRAAVTALRRSPLEGVSFLEVFGLGGEAESRGGDGGAEGRAAETLRRAVSEIAPLAGGVRLGLSPHAPYTCGPAVYRAAADLGVPIATHLAETPEEICFVERGEGPLADFLRRRAGWTGTSAPWGRHPIDALADLLAARRAPSARGAGPFLAAHANYLERGHIERLATWGVTVVYCPRASAYFGHPRGDARPHEYRAMMAASVNVALGTDGLGCLDRDDRVSVLDEMRFLFRRDGTDPRVLLAMGTTNGARGLAHDSDRVTLGRGAQPAGLIALPIDPASSLDPFEQVMRRDDAPEWLGEPRSDP